jgi:Flp pilus assembly CpaF family ATPase
MANSPIQYIKFQEISPKVRKHLEEIVRSYGLTILGGGTNSVTKESDISVFVDVSQEEAFQRVKKHIRSVLETLENV